MGYKSIMIQCLFKYIHYIKCEGYLYVNLKACLHSKPLALRAGGSPGRFTSLLSSDASRLSPAVRGRQSLLPPLLRMVGMSLSKKGLSSVGDTSLDQVRGLTGIMRRLKSREGDGVWLRVTDLVIGRLPVQIPPLAKYPSLAFKQRPLAPSSPETV